MRKKIAVILVLFIFAAALAGCSWTGSRGASAAEEVDERLVAANTDFAFRLYETLRNDNEQDNIFFSPTSIALALSMTYNGADGETKNEMANVMGIKDMSLEALNKANKDLLSILQAPDRDVKTSLANSLWPAEDAVLIDDFVKRNKDYYDAEASPLNFSSPDAVEKINSWVAGKTNNRIKELFKELSPTTRLVLVNALYFKGTWTIPFNKNATADADFYLTDSSTKTVPMMYLQDTLECLEGEEFKGVRLPYGQERLSMYVFVPDNNLDEFAANLTPANWENWVSAFSEKEDATVFLPRFSAEYKSELNEPLQEMGMVSAFGGGADFSGMTPGGGWYISLVVHQANIDVNEEGTEAAAATGVAMNESAPMDPFILRADHPFFIVIRDDLTGTILFMGEINNPQ